MPDQGDDKTKSVGSRIKGGLGQAGKAIGRGLGAVGTSILSRAKKGGKEVAGQTGQFFSKKFRQAKAQFHTYTPEQLQKARNEFNDVGEILRRAKDNPYLKAIKFDFANNTPLHAYHDAEAKTKATFAQKPKPKKDEEAKEDSEEQKAARAAVVKSYQEALNIDDDRLSALDQRLTDEAGRLGEKLDSRSKFTEGAQYNPAFIANKLHKAAVGVKRLADEQAPVRLGRKVEKTKAYFKSLKDSITGDDQTQYHDDVKNMIKAGIIEIKEGDGAKPVKEQVTEQLEAKEKAQLSSLEKQSEANKKAAITNAENLQDRYYKSLAEQVQLTEILRLQDKDKVMAAASTGEEDAEAGVTAKSKEEIEKGIKLNGNFLEKVAKEQGNKLKGPLGAELHYIPGEDGQSGTFVAELADLNDSQRQATIDFQAQVLFQQYGDSVAFTAESDNPNPEQRVHEVQRTIREQVRAVASIEGRSLKNQTFSGVRQTPDGKVEQVIYAQNPKGNQKPLSELFDADPELKKEYTNLLAQDKLTSATAEERFLEKKQQNADMKAAAAPEPAPPQPDDGRNLGGGPA